MVGIRGGILHIARVLVEVIVEHEAILLLCLGHILDGGIGIGYHLLIRQSLAPYAHLIDATSEGELGSTDTELGKFRKRTRQGTCGVEQAIAIEISLASI